MGSTAGELEGRVSVVKVALKIGSGGIGYDRRPKVKESENCGSGVRGCVVKSIGGGEELELLLLTSSMVTSSPPAPSSCASLVTSPCGTLLHKVFKRNEVKQPLPVCRRRESRLPDVSFSWALPISDLMFSLFNVELLTASLVLVVVTIGVVAIVVVMETVV